MTKPEPTDENELLAAVDELIIAWATGEDDKKPRTQLIKARRAVGEVVATHDQLLVVLEQQVKVLLRPLINEYDLCEMMRCHHSWLRKERNAGRWMNYEIDQRGRRYYTPDQILANMRGEKPKRVLKDVA